MWTTTTKQKQRQYNGSDLVVELGLPYLDLPLHGDAEEHDEVHYKNGPEHWHVEGFKECANHGYDDAFCRRMPGGVETKQLQMQSVKDNTSYNIVFLI